MNYSGTTSYLRQWWNDNSFPVYVFLITWLWLNFVSYTTLHIFPIRATSVKWCIYPQNYFLEGWARWDAGWFQGIAEEGYNNIAKNLEGQKDTAFFPVYPLLIRALNKIIPNIYLCGILISNAAFFAALIILYKIINIHYDEKTAKHSLILFSVYPFSLFFRAMYSESIFLLFVVAAFYMGEKKRWLPASLFAAAASATRIVGFLTIAGLIVLYLEQCGFDRKKIKPDIFWTLLGTAGLGGYMFFLGIKFGDPLIFVKNQRLPGWNSGTPIETIEESISVLLSAKLLTEQFYPLLKLFYILLFLICLGLCAVSWKKLKPTYFTWALLMILMASFGWRSMGRYTSLLFPLFISFALMLKKEIWFKTVVYLSIILLTFFTLLFTHAYWVA